MPTATLDLLTDPTVWTTHAPGGGGTTFVTVTPLGDRGLQISAMSGARATMSSALPAAVDLRTFTDLQLTVMADSATGTILSGWKLRLGGTGPSAIGAAGNEWARLVPGSDRPLGSFVLVSVGDLQPAARSALTTVRLTRVDARTIHPRASPTCSSDMEPAVCCRHSGT
jgi:hypothetical protein